MPRKIYSSKQKVTMVRSVEERKINDPSATRSAFARDLGVDPFQLRKWHQQLVLHQHKLTWTPGSHGRSIQDGNIASMTLRNCCCASSSNSVNKNMLLTAWRLDFVGMEHAQVVRTCTFMAIGHTLQRKARLSSQLKFESTEA
jgi:transposase-like protein